MYKYDSTSAIHSHAPRHHPNYPPRVREGFVQSARPFYAQTGQVVLRKAEGTFGAPTLRVARTLTARISNLYEHLAAVHRLQARHPSLTCQPYVLCFF
jgi:hypothetical protein